MGRRGYYWSHTAQSSTDSHGLSIDPAAVSMPYSNSRWFSFPLRYLTIFPLHEALDWVEAAEGETNATMVTVVRRLDRGRDYGQIVSPDIGFGGMRPTKNITAYVISPIAIRTYISATDKS